MRKSAVFSGTTVTALKVGAAGGGTNVVHSRMRGMPEKRGMSWTEMKLC
jgi:hypothetical protein